MSGELGDKIASKRLELNLSQARLASMFGISRNYLSQIELGKSVNMSWQLKAKIDSFLGHIELNEQATTKMLETMERIERKLDELLKRA